MKDLIIRDDDISYWTSVEEIDFIYRDLFDKGIKISFAVIPYAAKMYNLGDPHTFYQDENDSKWVGENTKLVKYLKEKIDKGLVEIMLHGYNHLYCFKSMDSGLKIASEKNLDQYRSRNKLVTFIGEYNYQGFNALYSKTKTGKEYLSEIFKVDIKNFVPPSNQIDYNGINAIVKNNLNISGLIGRKYNREFTIRGLITYFDRIFFKIINSKLTYPKIANFGNHKELVGYTLSKKTKKRGYDNQLKYCIKKSFPIQISTHYWEVDNIIFRNLEGIIDMALKNGYQSKLLYEVLK